MKYFQNKVIFLLLVLVLFQTSISAENKIEKIDRFVKHYADQGFLNGAVLIAENGKVIYKSAYGTANYEWNIPHQVDGIFQIYSVSKQFTSLIMLQLVQEDKVDLNDPITKYLNYYRKDTGDRIKIHHILSHAHGIAMPDWNLIPASLNIPLDEFVKTYLSGDLMFEPGSDSHYGSVGRGHVLAAAVIEKVTGQSFETVLHERVLKPLGMNQTGIFRHHEILPKYVESYRKRGNVVTKRIDRHPSQKMGASSMFSTLDDLFLWDRALYSEKLLSKHFIDKMYTPYIPMSGMFYGCGVHISSMKVDHTEKKLIWHTGGGVNMICRSIEDEHTVIFLNNIWTDLSLYQASLEILKILYDQPFELVKMHIYDPLRQVVENQGIDEAIAYYRKLKSNSPDYYILHENELNILGYFLLRNDHISDAIQIFELNVTEYPESGNVYDSLGEAYMKNGQTKLAIQNYKKSLELNPENTNAVEMLKNLKK